MKDAVLNYLKVEYRFRERSKKWNGIADLIIKKYHLDIDRLKLAEILADGSSADRYWRDILRDNVDLRGSDYGEDDGTKIALGVEKQRSLGYNI